ncbi:hypothetical protein GCM10027168_58500 [Streptomyces capparidis]
MTATRTRLLPALGVLLAGGLFLTGCGSDDSAASTPTKSSTSTAGAAADGGSAAKDGKDGKGGTATATGAAAQGGTSAKGGASASGGTQAGSPATAQSGTVTGTLTYLAPGKLMVGERAFFVATDTQIWGAGGICGDAAGQSASECTVEQLEKAAKTGKIRAEVEIGKDGIAVEIREQKAAGSSSGGGAAEDDRGDGTVTGVLTYLAPGKLMVGERAFFVATDTQIWGAGGICGDAAGQSASECTVEQLEKAAKTGKIRAEVEIGKDGIAVEIREQ